MSMSPRISLDASNNYLSRWKLESQRSYWSKALVELGLQRQDIVALTADLSSSVKTDGFAKKFPERHFNVGIAEANMMSVAAGMAMCGLRPAPILAAFWK